MSVDDRATNGVLALVGALGECQARLDEATARADEFSRLFHDVSEQRYEADRDLDRVTKTFDAVRAVAKEASEGKCIACRERPNSYPDIGLCFDCRLKALRHGLPS